MLLDTKAPEPRWIDEPLSFPEGDTITMSLGHWVCSTGFAVDPPQYGESHWRYQMGGPNANDELVKCKSTEGSDQRGP